MSGNNKPDRSLSPAAVSEESRRDLLARQHRALYGNESPAFFPAGGFADDPSRPDSQAGTHTPSSATGVRGPSPRGVDPFGLTTHTPGPASADGMAHPSAAASALQSPNRANSTSSPSSAINPVFGNGPDQPVTSTSSPGGADSPSSRQPTSKPTAGPIGSVGPIGSRPIPTTTTMPPNPGLTKRSTTPIPSPLGFGFTAGDAAAERASFSAPSNPPPPSVAAGAPGVGWGNGSGVWGSKNGLGVQASVWG